MIRKTLAAIILVLGIALLCAGCGSSTDGGAETSESASASTSETAATETSAASETSEAASGTAASSAEKADGDQNTGSRVIYKEISDIDETEGMYIPLNLDSIELLDSGTLILEPDDALEEAVGEKVTIATDATDVYVLPYGNGGFRSVLFIRKDGSVSALSTDALINSHEIRIMDNLGDYTEVKTIEGVQEIDAFGINALTSSGEKKPLDPYLE